MSIACTSAPSSTSSSVVAAPIPDAAPLTITRLPEYPSTSCIVASLPPLWLLDGDRLFRAVVGTHPRLRLERVGDPLLEHDAMAELVGAEHVGPEHVTTTVSDAEVGIDANCHHPASVSADAWRVALATLLACLCAVEDQPVGVVPRWSRPLLLERGSTHSRTGSGKPTDQARRRAYRLDSTLRLNQVQVLGSHNSYHAEPYPQVLAALRNVNAGDGRRSRLRPPPAPRAIRSRRPSDRARRVGRSCGRQVRAAVAAAVTRHPAPRPGDHAHARLQGPARSQHRHAFDLPHVRAVPPGGERPGPTHPATCRS